MKGGIGFLALCCISAVAAEIIYLQDKNSDYERRNLDFGLPENLNFQMSHSGKEIALNLRENKRLNANAPIYEPSKDTRGNVRAVQNPNIRLNTRVKYYQDLDNGAFMTAECMKSKSGPCVRLLTGNLVIDGQEHKLEPAMEEMNKRELPSHLGTPHKIEALTRSHSPGGISDHGHGAKVVTVNERFIDYVTHEPDTTTYSTTTEDYDYESEDMREQERKLANEFLIEKLLGRLNRQKRAPVAHGVEMLLAIDHVVYNDFATRYTGDAEIKYRIREYYAHVINGVDLRYASIQESDISVYVTISGFFISNAEALSPWMDYTQNPTDGLGGLSYMRTWRNSEGLPEHDHACLITGSNIQASGSSGVVGIAYLNGVCNSYRVSINEEYGLFKGSGVLAHELGHNLGAYHDANASIGCDPNDDYVMAPYVPSVSTGSTYINPWRFSTCSINYFRGYFNGLGTDCTLNQATIYDETEYWYHLRGLAGQIYSVDEQCELLRGDGASFCSGNQETSNICRNMGCQSAGSSSCFRYVAAHGTPCGNNLMCFEGLCTEPATNITTPAPPTSSTSGPSTTASPGEYQCEDVGSAGMTCPEIRTVMGGILKMCKRFHGPCCQYCNSNKGCKKDRSVPGAKKYNCATLVSTLGKYATCTLFPYECCKTCQA